MIRSEYLNTSAVTSFSSGSTAETGGGRAVLRKEELRPRSTTRRWHKNKILVSSFPACTTPYRTATARTVGVTTPSNQRLNRNHRFSCNYYIPNNKCACEEDRYCVLVRWSDFETNPNHWMIAPSTSAGRLRQDEIAAIASEPELNELELPGLLGS